jgi:hypothetical protein
MPYVESSAVSHVSYDHAKQILFVTFHRNPKIHAYFGVPAAVYREILRAPSIGAYINLRLKLRYRFRELTPVRLHA